MKQTLQKTVNICDGCKRESSTGILTQCPRCEKEYCYSCTHELYDVFNSDICKYCNQNEEVNAVLTKYHKKWLKDRAKIREEMASLKEQPTT